MAEQLLDPAAVQAGSLREQVQTATFPRAKRSAPEARRFVASAVGAHPAAEDAVMLASELVTNSLRHAHDAGVVTVTVAISASFIRIDVYDDGTAAIPHWREAATDAEGGRGFLLVNEIAQRWGFSRDQARTCCWAEVAAQPFS